MHTPSLGACPPRKFKKLDASRCILMHSWVENMLVQHIETLGMCTSHSAAPMNFATAICESVLLWAYEYVALKTPLLCNALAHAHEFNM